MSEILKKEIELISKIIKEEKPPNVVAVGKTGHFVTVLLEDGTSGACFIDPEMLGKIQVPNTQNEIISAIKLANGPLNAERSLGIALINAYSLWWFEKTDYWNKSYQIYLGEKYDPIAIIKPTKNDVVGQVGYITPYIKYWADNAGKVIVLEKNLKEDYDPRITVAKSVKDLAEANILVITGASLLYHSTEEILQTCKDGKLKGIIGPSCTMIPDPFFNAGADFVGGAKPKDGSKSFLAHLLEGRPINWFQQIYEKVIIFREGLSPDKINKF